MPNKIDFLKYVSFDCPRMKNCKFSKYLFERYRAARPSYQSASLAILITHADLWLDLSVSSSIGSSTTGPTVMLKLSWRTLHKTPFFSTPIQTVFLHSRKRLAQCTDTFFRVLRVSADGLSFMSVRMSGGGHGAGAHANWRTEGWVVREERARGDGSSIRVGSGRKRGKSLNNA